MHLHTIVKVKADSPDEAVKKVKRLLFEGFEGQGNGSFDWYAEDETKVIRMTPQKWAELRESEREEHDRNMKDSAEAKDEEMKGFYLMKAGECLYSSNFWSTERFAYEMDWEEGKKVYYVETNRHF